MKNIAFILLIICIAYNLNAQGFSSKLNIGIPVTRKSTDWSKPNYNIDFFTGKVIGKRSLFGAGASFIAVDMQNSYPTFSYDRKIWTVYISYIYEIYISEKVSVLPQMSAGYSFVTFKVNELRNSSWQHTDGVYISEGLNVSYSLSANFNLLAGFNFSTIFSEFKPNPVGIITADYLGGPIKPVHHFVIKTGLMYQF